MPIEQKNHVITIIINYLPNLENIFIICLQVGYIIVLHVYAETSHLAKHHSSLFFSQVSAGIVAQYTVDPRPSPYSVCATSMEQMRNCTSMAARVHD